MAFFPTNKAAHSSMVRCKLHFPLNNWKWLLPRQGAGLDKQFACLTLAVPEPQKGGHKYFKRLCYKRKMGYVLVSVSGRLGKWLHPGRDTHFPWRGEHVSHANISKAICRKDSSLISCKLQGSSFYKAFSCFSLQTIGSFILYASGQKQMANDDSSGSNLFLKNVLDPAQSSWTGRI